MIYKYQIPVQDDPIELEVPHVFKPVAVQLQAGIPCLWAEIEESAAANKKVTFQWVGTGHTIYTGTYIGTVQFPPLVFHLYRI